MHQYIITSTEELAVALKTRRRELENNAKAISRFL